METPMRHVVLAFALHTGFGTFGLYVVEAPHWDLFHLVNVFGSDDRMPQTRRGQAFGYAAIGRIYTNRVFKDNKGGPTQATGTAFLISPCVALTNYHVVFGAAQLDQALPYVRELDRQFRDNRDSNGNVNITLPNEHNYSVTFQVGENPDGTFKRTVVGRPVAFGNMDNQGGIAGDWAAIKFDEPNCPGSDKEIGYLELGSLSSYRSQPPGLHVAGYPGSKNPTIASHSTLYRSTRTCGTYGQALEEAAYVHNCSASDGQSGSPMLAVKNGRLKVVGIFQGAYDSFDHSLPQYDPSSKEFNDYANLAVSTKAVLPDVDPIVKRDLEKHGITTRNGQ
jgi:V8-like Glu-specific endopeptidase